MFQLTFKEESIEIHIESDEEAKTALKWLIRIFKIENFIKIE
jgi:hypothetical protein